MAFPIPPELLNLVFSYLRVHPTTLKAVRESSMDFAVLSRDHAFAHLVFNNSDHILEFFKSTSAAHSTVPRTLRPESVCFRDIGAIDNDALPKICDHMAQIHLKHSLAIHITAGGIPPVVIQLSGAWRNNVRQLSIRGGTHSPGAFFDCLASFPRLQLLALRSFQVEEAGIAGQLFKLPATVTHLSLSHCAPLWAFLGSRVQPGGGLNGVQDLYIQEVFFNGEDGIGDMRACFRELHSVHTITLDPVYQGERHPNFNCSPFDILRRSWEATLLQMDGLKLLRVNCATLPPKFATESVCMYAIQFSNLLVETETVVEIYAPHLLDLSSPSACEELLDATNAPNPTATTESRKANLVIRGLRGRLPREVGASHRVMVCEYPVAFMETNWEEAMGSRLDGF